MSFFISHFVSLPVSKLNAITCAITTVWSAILSNPDWRSGLPTCLSESGFAHTQSKLLRTAERNTILPHVKLSSIFPSLLQQDPTPLSRLLAHLFSSAPTTRSPSPSPACRPAPRSSCVPYLRGKDAGHGFPDRWLLQNSAQWCRLRIPFLKRYPLYPPVSVTSLRLVFFVLHKTT